MIRSFTFNLIEPYSTTVCRTERIIHNEAPYAGGMPPTTFLPGYRHGALGVYGCTFGEKLDKIIN